MSETRLGVLADSHGRAGTTGLAVRILLDAGATELIHLGDLGGPAVLDELVGHRARVVFGNCDLDEIELRRYAELMDIAVDHPLGELTRGDRSIAYTHGHLPAAMEAALRRRPAYLLHGHTHVLRDERIGGTRIINPGALFRASRYTAALLDPIRDELQVFEIPRTESTAAP